MTDLPPIDTRFELGDEITPEQFAFLEHHGFLHFRGVASDQEVGALSQALDEIEQGWIEERRRFVFGIPVFWGVGPQGRAWVQRFTFASVFSRTVADFVRSTRFEPIRRLIGEDARVGDREKDGVVVNRNFNAKGSVMPRLGWHTDGLRDLFYGRMPQRMLNVGLHFDRVSRDDGGLRLIPGSHKQSLMALCFRKPYFIWHREDRREFCVETEPGDLTVHDGLLWHRVARSSRSGEASLRRTMYVPYLTGPYEPKDESSPTPAYHHLGRFLRFMKGARAGPQSVPRSSHQ